MDTCFGTDPRGLVGEKMTDSLAEILRDDSHIFDVGLSSVEGTFVVEIEDQVSDAFAGGAIGGDEELPLSRALIAEEFGDGVLGESPSMLAPDSSERGDGHLCQVLGKTKDPESIVVGLCFSKLK